MAVGSQQSGGFRIPQAEGQTDLFVREPDLAESYVSGDTACSHLPEGEFPRHEIDRPVPDATHVTPERLRRNTVQNIFCGGRKSQLYLAPVITQSQPVAINTHRTSGIESPIEPLRVDQYFDSAAFILHDERIGKFAVQIVAHDTAFDPQILGNGMQNAPAQRFQIRNRNMPRSPVPGFVLRRRSIAAGLQHEEQQATENNRSHRAF